MLQSMGSQRDRHNLATEQQDRNKDVNLESTCDPVKPPQVQSEVLLTAAILSGYLMC